MKSSEDPEALLFLAEAGGDVPEIDLHGQYPDQALEAAERLLNAAFVRGDRVARIVHGKGEGRLREILHRSLSQHPLVLRFRESAGGGATVILLAEH
ncbi:MAG: Smr/MutS family protein [Patescibacteria group bacterium]|nr:MAG: Smr/MutS family protein [Patescibacteria group bacterium]